MNAASRVPWLALIRAALREPRMMFVGALGFSSGLPFGFVVFTVPVWLRTQGVSLTEIGLLSLATLPWGFKFLWSPLVDRFRLFGSRRRGWIAATQIGIAAVLAAVASIAGAPASLAVGILVLAIAFLSATQDIAVDAYAVETLRPEEYGTGNGWRASTYRVAMLVSGGIAISAAQFASWPVVFAGLAAAAVALVFAAIFAPEPIVADTSAPTFQDTVIGPFRDFLATPRAGVIAGFIFLYKLTDATAGMMFHPMLVDHGFPLVEIGLAQKTVGLVAAMIGAMAGGVYTSGKGIRAGLLVGALTQPLSNLAYFAVAVSGQSRVVLYGAVAAENICGGLGAAALMAYMSSLCGTRYCATQFALLTSLFGLSRSVAGAMGGAMAERLGYPVFFISTVALGLPALLLWGMLGASANGRATDAVVPRES
ncbi:MAG: MFS transporter [Deltaproteobacteria bacterium]|nr:MFS transporter [Deltaproteobacteria bacterium]